MILNVLQPRERPLPFARFPSVPPTFWRHFGHASPLESFRFENLTDFATKDRTRSLPDQHRDLGNEDFVLARDVQLRATGHVGLVLALDDGCQSATGLHVPIEQLERFDHRFLPGRIQTVSAALAGDVAMGLLVPSCEPPSRDVPARRFAGHAEVSVAITCQ